MRRSVLCVHNILSRAIQPCAQVVGSNIHQPLQGFVGGPRDVRCQQGIRQAAQRACLRQRFSAKGIGTVKPSFPFFSASATACSSTSAPRAVFSKIMPGFALARVAALISPVLQVLPDSAG